MSSSGPESLLQRRIQRALVAHGCFIIKHHANAYTGRGVPDLLGCLPGGRMIALETKTPEGRRTKIQERTIRLLKERGAAAGFAQSVDEALSICGLD